MSEVANEIFRQLGGNKFSVMTGAKNFLADKNSLSMKIGKNRTRANHLKITLNGKDLYDMVFSHVTEPRLNRKTWVYSDLKIEVLKEYNDVYNNMLQEVFTRYTELETRLPAFDNAWADYQAKKAV